MNNKKHQFNLTKVVVLFLSLFAISFNSCKNDDPVIPNEEELITTVNLMLISEDGKDTANFKFQDLDGDGGDEPIISVDSLLPNTTYNATVEILNEVESPAEDITEEVIEEGTDHQLFYVFEKGNVTVTYEDMDTDGNPLGVQTTMKTKDNSSDKLTLTLRHEPTKPNSGDLASAGGETDIEVEFDVEIQ